ncbi:MAG: Gfo/Idh/MocA family oxidoreductase [Opitutales bacterium]|jgi:predicted dehydrogenase|nr:Gfo/Idh/MocA family oxidoreductase [Opitutales bacterium]MDP4643148.1 Gfo/Idh/MocA family oxidoreductase [Opitutales bacterium]MDP4777133.1 Gfo/Idh/MocA family oxidoreductase [Opitutales bacterium]MDP4880044.1 Gfo/Idh/MocA family oxidoreductase [Opitutales bacterium]MDP4883296.1 Gfo/Idh/MocA family oxidoreductase [Opitutales bacterium]
MKLSRRKFILAGAAATGWTMLPGKVLGANERVNLAAIGLGQRGGIVGDFSWQPNVNVVALCDVDIDSTAPIANSENGRLGWANAEVTPAARAAKYPHARKFRDFRRMFDEMGDEIDAVCIAVPDHSHFPITMEAMMRGKHVYVEKPLARTFHECELLMKAEQKYGLVTQMGNQGHSGDNFFQFKEWKESGIIKDVTHVDAYMNSPRRWHPWEHVNGFPDAMPMPEALNWDVWNGTTPDPVEFSERMHYGNWRGWHQFGTGCFGDWGAHILDTIHEFLELGLPEKITAKKLERPNDFIFPLASTINFQFPARNGMPAMDIDWYDGTDNPPPVPKEMEGRSRGGPGKFIYSKDLVFHGNSHSSRLQILPVEKFRDMLKSGEVSKDYGKHSSHAANFIKAVRGEEQTRSPFSVTGPLCQMFALGCLAQRLGGELEFDRATNQITNNNQANSLLKDQVRKGWEQYYRV